MDKIREAIDFIEAHLFERITPEAIGKAINYAPSSFGSFFSAVTGYSPGEYIRFRRLSCAAELLAQGETSVTDAAFLCGYETVEAFSKAFRRFFGCAPSQFAASDKRGLRFLPININFTLTGGFGMMRNVIPGLQKVDWSDRLRQNEFVNSVISALAALGEKLDYDTVCALSGCAFRTSFSRPEVQLWNHGNYHVVNAPPIIEHTFKMLGYGLTQHTLSTFETDGRLIMASIDRGVPVVTLEGVISCSDACVISGYDNDGAVLLGYNPFMAVPDDHDEAPDSTGYFRKSNWNEGLGAAESQLRILIIGDKRERPSAAAAMRETKALAARLIREESLAPGQFSGLAAHRAFANALTTYEWTDNFEPYLNLMCNYKQYLDRQYAATYFAQQGEDALARIYEQIVEIVEEMGRMIPQDFSAFDMFSNKQNLRPYCDLLFEIAAQEEKAAAVLCFSGDSST